MAAGGGINMHGTQKPLPGKPKTWLLGYIDAAALILGAAAALSILGALFAQWWHVFDLMGQFAIPAVSAAALAAVVALARRNWRLATAAAGVGALGLLAIWRSEPVPACAQNTQTHRVVFFNLWVGNDALADALAFLEQSNADVIIVSELTKRSAQALAPLTRLYPHTTACARAGACWTAPFSRTAFIDVTRALELPGKSPALTALRVAFPDGEVTIAGAHLTRPWPFDRVSAQRRQLDALAKGLLGLPGPRLVVGDFNAVTWSATAEALTGATGLKPIPSWGTWLAPLPAPLRLPLDHAFVGEGISCASKTLGPALGSDHRPIVIDFALR